MLARVSVSFLALAIVATLLLSGALHAVIPHTHDDESSLAIHAALYVEKVRLASYAITTFALALALLVIHVSIVSPPVTTLERLLRRGIEPHRTFG